MDMLREHKSIIKLSVSAGQCNNTKSKELVPYPVLSRMSPLIGYPIPSGQAYSQIHMINTKQIQNAVFMYS